MTSQVVRIGTSDWRDQLIVELERTGGDPSGLFELLEAVIRNRAWETLTGEDGQPLGSLRRLIEYPKPYGCGQSTEKVLKLLDIEHRYELENPSWHKRMSRLRQQVKDELYEKLPPSSRQRNQGAEGDKIPIRYKKGTEAYIVARLKRDYPELAQKVITGELSAYQASIEAGFGKRRIPIYPDDVEATANILRIHFKGKNLRHLIKLLETSSQ